MGEINMDKLVCLRKFFLAGCLILVMLFMLGCSSGGSDPFADNNYDEAGDSDSTDSSIFDGAAGAGGAIGGIGAGIALNEMAFPPANLNAQKKSATQIDLSWDESTGNNIDGYKIYRDGTFVKSVDGTSTTDEGLEPGTRYCYQIAAYNDLMESLKIETCAKTYFTRRWGTTTYDYSKDVTVDANGNIYVVGFTEGNMYKKIEYYDVFLTKFNAAGVEQWTRQLNTDSETNKSFDPNLGVAVDASGNIYVTGNTSLNLNPAKVVTVIPTEGYDAFLAKFDTNGNTLWTRMLGSPGDDYGTDVAVDINGNVYISGYTDGNLDGHYTKDKGAGYDMFLAMYDPRGYKLWVKQLDMNDADYGWGVAVDANGHIYVSGTTGSGAIYQVRTKSGSPESDMFLARYSITGALEWVRTLNSQYIVPSGCRVAVGADGIYVTGSTTGNLDGNHSSTGYDMFLVKYSFAGFKLWLRQLGDSGDDYGSDVTVDAKGYLYVTGTTGSNPFDGNYSFGWYDIFITKYDASGNKQWTTRFGSDQDDGGVGVAAAGGYIFAVGNTNSYRFDGNIQIGNSDAFLMKYDSDGVRQ